MIGRNLRLCATLLAFYFIATTGYLLHRSFAETRTSINLLQLGENSLMSDPVSATKDFQLSQRAAEQSIGSIREARWWNRLISLLPPLRWQVQLAKASYSLAQAGESTIALQQSLAALDQLPASSNDPIITTGNRFLHWYTVEGPTVSLLQAQLSDAKENFGPIPDWIFLSQSDNFIRLQQQLSELSDTINSDRRTGDGILSLAKNSKTALIVLLPSGAADPGSLGTLSLQDGRIQALTFAPLPVSLLATYRTGSQRGAFWPQTARSLAVQSAGSGEPAGAITVIDPSLIKDFLRISGPIQLIGVANPVVSAANWDGTQGSTDQLIGQLSAVSLQSAHKSDAISSLKLALQNQALQIWSSDVTLLPTLVSLPDYAPPSGHGNWLRVLPQGPADLNITLTQTRRTLQQDTLVTLSAISSGIAPHVALPYSALIDDNSPSSVRSGYLEATMLPSSSGYSLRYALPRTTAEPSRILYLAPLSGTQKVTAFGQEKLITRDAILTP